MMCRLLTACYLTIMPSLLTTAQAENDIVSPLERWRTEVSIQAKAAEAALAIQTQILADTKKRLFNGQATNAEAQYARESQLQSIEWNKLLQSEAAVLRETIDDEENLSAAKVRSYLRLPGMPLLFASDEFAWIELPDTPQVNRIVAEIQYLDDQLHNIALSAVQVERLQRQLDRLRPLKSESPELQAEINSLRLHLLAAQLTPDRLFDVLSCPIIQIRSADDDFNFPAAPLLAVTRRWERATRQILLGQTKRTIDDLRTLLPNEEEEQKSLQLQTQIESHQNLANLLIRDLTFLNTGGNRFGRTVTSHSGSRAGHLMRVMKRQWEEVQEELKLARNSPAKRNTASRTSVEPVRILERDLETAEVQVKFAMELYQLDSGRSDDTQPLFDARLELFALAANLHTEKAVLESQVNAARESLISDGHAEFYDVEFAGDQIQILELQRQRLDLRELRAKLCFKLARITNDRQAVARHED